MTRKEVTGPRGGRRQGVAWRQGLEAGVAQVRDNRGKGGVTCGWEEGCDVVMWR